MVQGSDGVQAVAVVIIAEMYDAWALTLSGSRWKTAREHRRYIVGPLGHLPFGKLTTAALHVWRESLATMPGARAETLSPGYRQNIRTTLSACLSHHVRMGAIPMNPLAGLPRDKAVDNNRQGYFTPDALASFLPHAEAVQPMLRDICVVAATCGGLRATEALGLRRDQIDHHARKLVVLQKGGRIKRPIAPDRSYELVCSRLKANNSWHVFPSLTDPSRPVPYITLNSWWERAVASWGQTLLGEKPVFHMLRHGFVVEMLRKGMPTHWIASQTGHKNAKEIEQRYGVLRGQAEEQARALINASGLVLG